MAFLLRRAEGLELEIGALCVHSEDAEGVGVAETTLPPLNSDDDRSRCDEIQRHRVPQPEADAVVNLF